MPPNHLVYLNNFLMLTNVKLLKSPSRPNLFTAEADCYTTVTTEQCTLFIVCTCGCSL